MDGLEHEGRDQGYVRIARNARGEWNWTVMASIGTSGPELEAARVIAEQAAGRLDRDLAKLGEKPETPA